MTTLRIAASDLEPERLRRLVGISPGIARVRELIRQYAPTELSILIVGPTGSGKELCAAAIHEMSGRTGAFVPVDCAALPRELVEGELFGHRRGAYTHAVTDMKGLVVEAHRGTLFLDELSHLRGSSQAKLLRTLETGEVRPLGDERRRWVDLRLVSAVQPAGNGGSRRPSLREDLAYRIAQVVLQLPALRDRPEDIPLLAEHFARERGTRLDRSGLGPLLAYPWPGNVRELRAVIARAAVLGAGRPLDGLCMAEALGLGWLQGHVAGAEPRQENHGRLVIESLLEAHGGDTAAVAKALGVSRSTVYRRLAGLGISVPRLCKSRLRIR